jgi:hypothetical protein
MRRPQTEKNMNQFEQSRETRSEFAPNTRFAMNLAPAAPFRGDREADLDQLKGRLLQQAIEEATDSDLYAPLRRAANEAAALAWATWYPLLVFPALFEEKALTAVRQAAHQAEIRQRSRGLAGNWKERGLE